MQRSSQGVRYLILEMALITFAVVLGFAVTNWDMSRKEKRRSRVAVDRIRLELERNVSGLATAAPYYVEMSERLDSILGTDGGAPLADVTIAGNLTRVSEWQTVFSLLAELSALARRDGEQVLGLLPS